MSAARVAALAVALVLGTAPVRAQDASTPNSPNAVQTITTLVLTVGGDDAEARALGGVVGDLIAGVHVTVDVRRVDHVALWEIAGPPDTAHPEAARAWVDLTDPARAVVYVKDAAHDRVLLREITRSGVSPELSREELGHILQASVEGLLTGAEVGAPRAELLSALAPTAPTRGAPAAATTRPSAPRATPVLRTPRERPRSEPSPGASRRWHVRIQYAAEWVDTNRVSDGPGAVLQLGLLERVPLGAALAAEIRRPMTIDADPVSVRLTRGIFRAALTWDQRLGRAWIARFEAGGGVDATRISPESSADPAVVEVAADRTVWSGIARLGAGLDAELAEHAGLWFGATLDLDPNGTHLVYARRNGDQGVFRPWPVRPALAMGLVL